MLDQNYEWQVIASTWIPWRFFEIQRRDIVDALVAQRNAYYRVEDGLPFSECKVYSATVR